MKIYHCVESYYPAVGGMQEVVKQLSERLVKLGHDVTVLTRFHQERNFKELNGVKVLAFNVIGNPKAATTDEEKNYVKFLLELKSDIITFFAAQHWATDLALVHLKRIQAKKVSVPTGYSGLYWPEFKQYFIDMKKYIHDYDMNVYLSDNYRDINFARENGVKNTILIANGAAADEFLPESKIDVRKQLKIPQDHFLLLHVGSYTGWKGHKEAIEVFFRSEIRNATFLLIGNNYEYFKRQFIKHPKFALLWFMHKLKGSKKVVFNYFPRDFTVSAYKQADLFFFPSNIECSPIVLFECAAAKLPFLATDVGNSIEIAEWTKGGVILKTSKDEAGFSHMDIEEGIKSLNEMYKNQKLRLELAQQAHAIWKEKYSWEIITKNYENLYLSLIK
ncbi:MAG: glycosyltransferase family 4 protein [Sphingobacteriaceae bacterium]|nr:glycosyltransferase family 4 protein [Sphingobacteriaceae bacterium]